MWGCLLCSYVSVPVVSFRVVGELNILDDVIGGYVLTCYGCSFLTRSLTAIYTRLERESLVTSLII